MTTTASPSSRPARAGTRASSPSPAALTAASRPASTLPALALAIAQQRHLLALRKRD